MDRDAQLILEYIRDGSQPAFTEIVQRHIDAVYASALRQTRDAALAEDVTQAVFLMLAKKAATLRPEVVLAGWLMTATWYACKNAMRVERRRKVHEAGAAAMKQETGDASQAAGLLQGEIESQLDQALQSLSEVDRAAVVMHYLRGREFAEVAIALKTTTEGARKRIERAVAKLRMRFAQAGMELTPAVVGTALLQAGADKAPSALTAKVIAPSSAGAAAIAGAGLRAMAIARAKLACAVFAAAICAAGLVVVTHHPYVAATASVATRPAAFATGPAAFGPLETLRRSGAAVNGGDGETFRSLIAITNDADRAFIDLVAENIHRASLFKSAYRNAFGAAAPEPLSVHWVWPSIPAATPVFITGDRASVLLPEGTVQMVNVDGQWKLTVPGISVENGGNWHADSPRTLELVRLDNLAYAETTDAIAQGRFTSADQARTELRNRLARSKATASTKATTRLTVETAAAQTRER